MRILENTKNLHWDMIRTAWSSVADTAIVPMQDLLGLDQSARMNIPSTMGINWMWRLKEGQYTDELADKLLRLTEIYGRK